MSAGLAFMGNGGQGMLTGLGNLHGRRDEAYTKDPTRPLRPQKLRWDRTVRPPP